MSDSYGQRLIKRLFGEGEPARVQTTLVAERLERSARFEQERKLWLYSGEAHKEIDILRNRYHSDLATPDLFLHRSPQANGFFFNPSIGIKASSFAFLLDYFRDICLETDYQLYNSKRTYEEVPTGVKRSERYYLKPNLDVGLTIPIDQKFGNIQLDLVIINEIPSYLKVMVSVYSDRNYRNAEPFEEFMEGLLA